VTLFVSYDLSNIHFIIFSFKLLKVSKERVNVSVLVNRLILHFYVCVSLLRYGNKCDFATAQIYILFNKSSLINELSVPYLSLRG